MTALPLSPEIDQPVPDSDPVSPLLKWPAVILSYIFHPLFIPVYAGLFLVFIHPSYFSGFGLETRKNTILILFLNTAFYPLFCVLLLKAVGFIQSVYLRTQRDRIIPYIACGVFYFWTYMVFKQQTAYPRILPAFILGVFLASSTALIANIYFKISLHAIGLGGWLGLFFIIAKNKTMLMTWPLAALLLIIGLVCTSRLLVSNHTQKDIYTGLFVGILTQFIAAYVVM